MAVIYKITRTLNGVDEMLGHLSFDDENNVTLTLAGQDAAHKDLQATWDKVGQIDPLPVVRRVREKMDDGSFVTKQVAMQIAKTDRNYPPAVVMYLGEYHGYFLAKDFDAMAAQE